MHAAAPRHFAAYTAQMSRVTIGFAGQCHISGYEGVSADAAFPQVCRRVLQAARPNFQVELALESYHHPAELHRRVAALLPKRPRAVVLEVVGWIAISGSSSIDLSRLPRGVRSAYERARHLRQASQNIGEKTRGSGLIHIVQSNALAAASGLLRPLLPRLPRPTLAEYESSVADALDLITAGGAAPVVQGPGAGNFAGISKRLPDDAIRQYVAVNQMARRVAEAKGALYVDRWDTVSAGFFIPGTTRPTTKGQSMWGHLLADHLLRAGIV